MSKLESHNEKVNEILSRLDSFVAAIRELPLEGRQIDPIDADVQKKVGKEVEKVFGSFADDAGKELEYKKAYYREKIYWLQHGQKDMTWSEIGTAIESILAIEAEELSAAQLAEKITSFVDDCFNDKGRKWIEDYLAPEES